MPKLDLDYEQIIQLVKHLPPEKKREIILTVAKEASSSAEERMQYAEERLRNLAAARGLNWDAMEEQQKEDFVDGLIHEDRAPEKKSGSYS